jgi:hypothetical protein
VAAPLSCFNLDSLITSVSYSIRMKPSVIVWDLETVPDLGGFAAANDLVGKSDADIREVLGNRFPKHIYHTIVRIGALIAHRESDHWAVDALRLRRERPSRSAAEQRDELAAFHCPRRTVRGHEQIAVGFRRSDNVSVPAGHPTGSGSRIQRLLR